MNSISSLTNSLEHYKKRTGEFANRSMCSIKKSAQSCLQTAASYARAYPKTTLTLKVSALTGALATTAWYIHQTVQHDSSPDLPPFCSEELFNNRTFAPHLNSFSTPTPPPMPEPITLLQQTVAQAPSPTPPSVVHLTATPEPPHFRSIITTFPSPSRTPSPSALKAAPLPTLKAMQDVSDSCLSTLNNLQPQTQFPNNPPPLHNLTIAKEHLSNSIKQLHHFAKTAPDATLHMLHQALSPLNALANKLNKPTQFPKNPPPLHNLTIAEENLSNSIKQLHHFVKTAPDATLHMLHQALSPLNALANKLNKPTQFPKNPPPLHNLTIAEENLSNSIKQLYHFVKTAPDATLHTIYQVTKRHQAQVQSQLRPPLSVKTIHTAFATISLYVVNQLAQHTIALLQSTLNVIPITPLSSFSKNALETTKSALYAGWQQWTILRHTLSNITKWTTLQLSTPNQPFEKLSSPLTSRIFSAPSPRPTPSFLPKPNLRCNASDAPDNLPSPPRYETTGWAQSLLNTQTGRWATERLLETFFNGLSGLSDHIDSQGISLDSSSHRPTATPDSSPQALFPSQRDIQILSGIASGAVQATRRQAFSQKTP